MIGSDGQLLLKNVDSCHAGDKLAVVQLRAVLVLLLSL